jgi:hypothetical protein
VHDEGSPAFAFHLLVGSSAVRVHIPAFSALTLVRYSIIRHIGIGLQSLGYVPHVIPTAGGAAYHLKSPTELQLGQRQICPGLSDN